jgi:hypothetical protein
MLKRIKDLLTSNIGYLAKITYLVLIITLLSFISDPAQNNDYWINAPTGSTKVFTISFIDEQNGEAVSAEGDVMLTQDGGSSWNLDTKNPKTINNNGELYWKADIYCSVMQSTDGGETWVSYDKERQEHFCGVYHEDKNTGHNIASQFLNKVTSKVFLCLKNNEINTLINHPQQCAEYYRSPTEGWALGWCIRNFNKTAISKGKN